MSNDEARRNDENRMTERNSLGGDSSFYHSELFRHSSLVLRHFCGVGAWFWVVIVLGAALRFYLVVFTDGTQDVAIWERHARDVHDRGLIGYYRSDPSANHPPFISEAEALSVRVSDATGIPFRILLRAPFA